MFQLAIVLGIIAFSIFLTGLFGWLYIWVINIIFIIPLLILLFYKYKKIKFNIKNRSLFLKLNKLEIVLLILLSVAIILNFISALVPEIWFDSLWYHLTIPKIYLQNHQIKFLKGDLFYYSGMPQLMEFLYLGVLSISNEIGVKILHFLFGLFATFIIIDIGKKHFNLSVGLFAGLLFFSDLSVAWLTGTAYIDLGRTFFEILSVKLFLDWLSDRENKQLVLVKSGIVAGLAVGTKYFALGLVGILSILIFGKGKNKFRDILSFLMPASLLAIIWLIYAYINTGNPVYPIFTSYLDSSHHVISFNFLKYVWDFISLSNFSKDWLSPISPVFLITIPFIVYLLILRCKTFNLVYKYLLLISVLSYTIWYFIPRTGGSRFIVPYLPIFYLIVASTVLYYMEKFFIKKYLIILILFIISGNLLFRFYINLKQVDYFIGKENKTEYLIKRLDLNDVFFDIDNYFSNNLTKDDLILVYGGHSLYYLDIPFVHESYYDGEVYNYIMTLNTQLPNKYKNIKLIYSNKKIKLKLYKIY